MSKITGYLYNLATDKERGPLACAMKGVLFVLSLVYGLIVRSLIFFKGRKRLRLNCRVISIGNLTLGGTGKTTTVLFVARYLSAQGRRVAVLSRGQAGTQNLSDEPRMLAANLKGVPVIADTDRMRAAKQVIEKYAADTIVLDDGLQQWHIEKDLEVVTIDAACPFGNGRLLPRGVLRQPVSCLRKPDVFLITKTDIYPDAGKIKDTLSGMFPSALVIETVHRPVGFYPLNDPGRLFQADSFSGKKALLFSGIGDPDSFEKLVQGLGVEVKRSMRFGDHYHYHNKDLASISLAANKCGAEVVITTEKDAARIKRQAEAQKDADIVVLRIELGFKENGQDRFINRLRVLYTI